MSKKKKIIVIILFILVIGLTILASIGLNYEKPKPQNNEPKEEPKPKIIEEYTTVELNTLAEYKNYLNYEDNKVSYYNYGDEYIVYKNGILLQKPEYVKAKDNTYEDYIEFKKYIYYVTDAYEEYCLKDKSNNEIECYNEIQKVSNLQGSTDYLILTKEKNNEKTITLLNPNTNESHNLSDINVDVIYSGSMADDESGNINTYEYDYLPACSTFEKCGLINYQGKVVIDYVYDFVDYIDKNTIVVTKNEKLGIINYKNEVRLPLEYDDISISSNHILAIKDFKLNVLNRNMKTIVKDIDIDSSESETGYNYFFITNNKDLYLYIDNETLKTVYLINTKLQRKIESKGELEYVYDDDKNWESLKYITFSYVDNNKLYVVFYDLDLYEYYTFSKEIKNNIDFYTTIYVSNKNKNYFIISLQYDIEKYNEYYYIDLINSKEIDEITALGKHFSNGYTYTIIGGKLNIYKEKELLNSFNGDFTHLNEYTFLQTGPEISKILTLEFKKESREVQN